MNSLWQKKVDVISVGIVSDLIFIKETVNEYFVKTSIAVNTQRWTGVFFGATKWIQTVSPGEAFSDNTGCNNGFKGFDGTRLSCGQLWQFLFEGMKNSVNFWDLTLFSKFFNACGNAKMSGSFGILKAETWSFSVLGTQIYLYSVLQQSSLNERDKIPISTEGE